MKIKSVRFANFKRIANTRIEFNEDLNIFVGANNSGKTSVLEAIGLLLGIKNIKPSKVLSYYLQGNGRVDIKITLQLSKQEWESLLKIEASIDKRYEIFFNEEYLQSLTNEFTLHLSVIIDFKSNQNISQNNASYIVDLDQSQKTFTEENIQLLNKIAKNILGYDKFYLFNNPLYIDSNDIIVDEEDFIPEKDLINKGMGYKNRVRAKLYYLKQNDLEKFEQIKKEILETFPEIKDFDIVFNMQEGKFEFNIQESIRKNGHFVDVNYDVVDVGMGMKNLLLIVANILLTQPSVVLMDEPDAHMHPILIKKFVQILQKFSSETQFFITTHNIIFVNTVELSKIYSINYIPTEKGSIIKKLNETNEVLDLTNRLGYEISNFNYTTNPKVYVFCEGKTDKDIIISFAKKLNVSNKINDFNTCFIPLEGKNDVNKLITLIKKLETNIIKEPFLFLIDKDEVTKEKLEEFKKKHFKENPNRLFFLAKRQIENYLIDINALEKIILSKNEKKRDNKKIKNEKEISPIDWNKKIYELVDKQREKIYENFLYQQIIDNSLLTTETIRNKINDIKSNFGNEIIEEFSAKLTSDFTRNIFKLIKDIGKFKKTFDEEWNIFEKRLDMCDGRELLTEIRKWVQEEFKISFSNNELIENIEEVNKDIQELIERLCEPSLLGL